MRKVFLDDLPHKGKLIDWINSIGYKFKFIYDDVKGELEIIDYNQKNHKLNVKYNNNIYYINTDSVLNCKLGLLLEKLTKKYKYNIGDILEVKSGKIEILEQIRIKNGEKTGKGYKYKCFNCNEINTIKETHLKNKIGCCVCSNIKIKIGFNDIWTTNKNLAQLLLNPDDGYKYTLNSGEKLDWKCPNCNLIIKNKTI